VPPAVGVAAVVVATAAPAYYTRQDKGGAGTGLPAVKRSIRTGRAGAAEAAARFALLCQCSPPTRTAIVHYGS
jgi:hypothetical protein